MKKFSSIVLLIGAIGSSNSVQAGQKISSGVGIGSLYSTAGINGGVVVEKTFYYASIGCPTGYKMKSGGYKLTCGLGVGLSTGNMLPQIGNKHAIGMYYGITSGAYREGPNGIEETSSNYGVAMNYSYFFGGIDNSGWNIGLSAFWVGKKLDFPVIAIPAVGFQYVY